jgi:ABC-type proline/glycine betaine transport system permease subunit
MNTFTRHLTRDLTCVLAAAVITLVLGMAFVQSTRVAPGAASLARAAQPAALVA